jgi:single-strand DNA-binding protein
MSEGSVSKAILVGKLGVDPTVRRTQLGRKVTALNVKTSGEKGRKQWHRIVIYNENVADFAERYLRKGSHVYIEGSLEVRKWIGTNGEGQNWTVEIVVNGFDGRLVLLDPPPSDKLEDRDAGTEGLDATDDTDNRRAFAFSSSPGRQQPCSHPNRWRRRYAGHGMIP